MKDVLLQEAIKLNMRKKRKTRWKRLVQVMAAAVCFCTVYVLMLPAVTLSSDPLCGQKEHSHREECYNSSGALICGQVLHNHSEACYTAQEKVTQLRYDCGYGAHTHNTNCYDANGSLSCTIPEHTHDSGCNEALVVISTSVGDVLDQPVILNAEPVADTQYHVWLDGTLGGLATFSGSPNSYYSVSGSMVLPEIWDSPTVYNYTLKGWYDVTSRTYYQPGDTVTITQDTVFYADWIAASYDIGIKNSNVVDCVDTSEFITMKMFDYNALFNTLSFDHTGTISDTSHKETWDEFEGGLEFVFRDQDGSGKLSRPGSQTKWDYITLGLVETTDDAIMQALFGNGNVIGRQYLGGGNYLFQYMNDAASDYYGYYYYDSAKNAASYNQGDGRFYVYDYLERTTDSGSGGSDFLPLNSPYTGVDMDPKSDGAYAYNATSRGNEAMHTNYFFGMQVDIEFYLSNKTGAKDAYGNYGNLDIHGNPMKFRFSGDDDLWVFIDGKLVLDVGGLHAALEGTIDFSTGKVVADDEAQPDLDLEAGSHTMSVYYLERGASLSNCAIYFNLEPRYGLELEKQDFQTGESIDGVAFDVFMDENCTNEAELWPSYDDAKKDAPSGHTFVTKDGALTMWGLVPGKVYYLRENKEASADKIKDIYQFSDDVIRVILNSHGTDLGEMTILRGEDGQRSEGFEVTGYRLNEITQNIRIVVTNPKITDVQTQKLKVFKTWSDKAVNIPDSIRLYLTANGKRLEGSEVELTAANGWIHTWSMLPIYDENGKIEYSVQEVLMEGYHANVTYRAATEESIDWLEVKVMEDSATYLLLLDGEALALNGSKLTTVSLENAKDAPTAQWSVAAYRDGFRIYQGDYTLVLQDNAYFTVSTEGGNQTMYFDGSDIFAVSNNTQYYMSSVNSSGQVTVSTKVQNFVLMKQEVTPVEVQQFVMENTPIDEEDVIYLEVSKQWDTALDVSDREVVIHLMADGKDTGLTATLNAGNNWAASFEGLYNGMTYSVQEQPMPGYIASYSDVKATTRTITQWYSAGGLALDKTYCFIYNGKALTANGSSLSMTSVDTANVLETQQWMAVSYQSKTILKNVATNSYLYCTRSGSSYKIALTSSQSSAYTAALSNGRLSLKSGSTTRYLKVDNTNTSVSAVSGTSSATTFTANQKTTAIREGLAITVTNTYIGVELPETGGPGVYGFYIAGTALIGVALGWMIYEKKRNKKYKTKSKEAQS